MPDNLRKAQELADNLRLAARYEFSDPEVLADAADELERLDDLLNNPSIEDFLESVRLEAGHQQERWGQEHDDQKSPSDWRRLLDYLTGKAAAAQQEGNRDKALHHTISSAAALSQWHKRIKAESDDGNHSPNIAAE